MDYSAYVVHGSQNWRYWRARGVVIGVGNTWFNLLRSPIEKAVYNLVGQNYGGNPRPVVMIDEFGFDYGGRMDEKSAQILRQTKRRKPELPLAVWEMRVGGRMGDGSRGPRL